MGREQGGLNRRQAATRRHLLALEPRMMFDAAAVATGAAVAADAVADSQAQAHVAPMRDDAAVADRHPPTMGLALDHRDPVDAVPAATAPRDVIFIDTNVTDFQRLADEWADRGTVILIDGGKDGLDQVNAALAGQHDLGAIHLVSHGSEGVVWLGTTRLDAAAIQGALAAPLAAVGRSLAAGGDILIYGCDFAEGDTGATALDAFARATGADVAASTDPTGYAARGGDWDLEAQRGDIQTRMLDSGDWRGLLAPIAISVQPDTLTVRDANGTVVASGATGFTNAGRSADVAVGATATWAGAATYNGRTVDLRATVVSLSAGDALRFDRPTSASDDAGFLLRNVAGTTTGTSTTQIRWELVDATTGNPLPADVRFTIADIDGVGGAIHTRESLVVATDNLSYFTRERVSDIQFTATLASIDASGTQNELASPPTTISAASFDWTNVSAFTITYNLNRAGSTQAAFYHDGDADFVYNDPVFTSIPRLDLDADDSSATGTAAASTFVENGAPLRIVDQDLAVTNPAGSVTRATLVLTNAKPGDVLAIGTLPAGITGSIDTSVPGRIVATLTGNASAATYETAIKAVTFQNAGDAPDTTQRTVDVAFSNETLTSAVSTARITVVAVNDAPVANADTASVAEDRSVTIPVLANDTDVDGNPLTVTTASALHGQVVRNPDNTLTYTPTADYNGADTISYTIADGQGGTASSTVAVRVQPQADAPTITAPAPQSLAEDTALTFSTANGNALAIASADGGVQQVTLTVTQGTLTLGQSSGLTFLSGDGTADATMRFRGTVAAINAALQGATYTPGADRNGPAQLDIAVLRVAVEGEDFQNGDVERPAVAAGQFSYFDEGQVPGWATTATDNRIEIWGNGHNGVTAYSGTQFFEINATEAASLYQEFRSTAASPVTIGFAHRGRSGVDVMQLTATDLGADGVFGTADDVVLAQLNYTDGAAGWGAYSKQLTAAASGNVIRVDFRSISTANGDQTTGNFLDAVTISQSSVPFSAAQTVAVTIDPVADIAPDSATTAEDSAVTFAPLANDGFADPARAITAVDGRAITAGGAAVAVANGTVALDSLTRFVFTPNADFNGTTSFTYTVTAGGRTETATDTITVTPVDDAPIVATPLPSRTASDRATVSYPTAGGFSDADGDTLTYSATGLPAGLSIDAATGVISGTLGRSASQLSGGVYTVTVTAREAAGARVSQTFTITATNPAPVAVDDSATTAENSPVVIAPLVNDSDPDGDPIAVTGATAAHGRVAIASDGTVTYTPDTGYVGSDTVDYTIGDAQGGTASARIAITITNTPPTSGTVPAQSALDGQPVQLPLGPFFTKPDGATLTYSATALPPGLAIDPATGAITGTIARSASQSGGGRYDTVVTADDGRGGRTATTFRWTVSNPAPQARNDTATTGEDVAVRIAPLANDTDPDGDPLAIVAATAAHGTVAINADGTIDYTPDADWAGSDTILYTIDDGQGGRSTATVSVAIAAANDAPTTTGLSARDTADAASVSVPTAPAFADVDGDTLGYTATGLPPGLSINPATGVIGGTIVPGSANGGAAGDGVYAIVVTATDASGAQVDAPFTWVVRQVPPIANDDVAITPEDRAVTVAVLANDTDPNADPLTIVAATGTHGTVSIDGDAITFTPDADFTGVALVTYTIDDGNGGRSTATVTITVTPVNDAPDVSPRLAPAAGQPYAIESADAQSGILVDAGMFFTDRDGDALAFAATGLPPGLMLDPATGRITGTLDRSASTINGGAYVVTLTATDPTGATASGSFRWFVADPAPLATADSATTAEDTGVVIPVLTNDSDPDGDPLTVVSASAAHGSVAIATDGTLTYTPDADFNGADTILYTIDDGEGGRSTAAVIVTVTPVPDAPVIVAPLPGVAANEGDPVRIDAGAAFADRDGDALVYSATGLPAGLIIDPATGVIGGTLDRSAAGAASGGRYPIIVVATDPSGLQAASRFDLVAANPAPVAAGDAVVTAEDIPVRIAVLANDSDPDRDPLTVVAAQAAHGSVAIAPDGTLTYTPDPDFNGTDIIVYTIDDGDGGRATASVDVTVTAIADAPAAFAPLPGFAARDGDPVRIAAGPAFTDRDGDPLVFTATGLPPGLVIDPTSGTIAGTLDRSAATAAPGGRYTITVTATDPSGLQGRSTFDLTVTNPAPLAAADTARTGPGAPVRIDVLANDIDPDGDPLRVTGASAANGTVTIGADGSIAYQPGPTFAGTDIITYVVDDGQGGTATATVTVTVDPPNRAPVTPAPGVPLAAVGGVPLRLAPLAGVTDADGDVVTVTGATASAGTVRVDADGTILYTPALGFVGTATITYTVADPRGGVATGTLLVRVTDGRSANVEALLRFGQVVYDAPVRLALPVVHRDPAPASPMTATIERIRSLRSIAAGPDTGHAILDEVERLARDANFRDAAGRLFDPRWGDFLVDSLTGFSAASDPAAGIMIDSVVRGHALYLEVHDIAADGTAPISSIALRLPNGGAAPDWIRTDARGLAIIERPADADEIRLVVRVTRADGHVTTTPIVIQGATGETEIDRADARPRPPTLNQSLAHPHHVAIAAATRLTRLFEQ